MKKIGIYSGAFDPVHIGHVAFALETIDKMQLDAVYFLPEPRPRQKQQCTPINYRMAMLQLAVKKYSNLYVMQLPYKQFTVHTTLPYLQNKFAGNYLVYMCGSDVIDTFTYRWPGLDILLSSVELAIGLRQKDTKKSLEALLNNLPSMPKYKIIQSPHKHMASTHIRVGNNSITDLDPDVAAYISQLQLYS